MAASSHFIVTTDRRIRTATSRVLKREDLQVNNEPSDPTLQPGMAERAIDTATDVSRTITEISAGLQAAVERLRSAPLPGKRRLRACLSHSCSAWRWRAGANISWVAMRSHNLARHFVQSVRKAVTSAPKMMPFSRELDIGQTLKLRQCRYPAVWFSIGVQPTRLLGTLSRG